MQWKYWKGTNWAAMLASGFVRMFFSQSVSTEQGLLMRVFHTMIRSLLTLNTV
jgi:hypothetical protein